MPSDVEVTMVEITEDTVLGREPPIFHLKKAEFESGATGSSYLSVPKCETRKSSKMTEVDLEVLEQLELDLWWFYFKKMQNESCQNEILSGAG